MYCVMAACTANSGWKQVSWVLLGAALTSPLQSKYCQWNYLWPSVKAFSGGLKIEPTSHLFSKFWGDYDARKEWEFFTFFCEDIYLPLCSNRTGFRKKRLWLIHTLQEAGQKTSISVFTKASNKVVQPVPVCSFLFWLSYFSLTR